MPGFIPSRFVLAFTISPPTLASFDNAEILGPQLSELIELKTPFEPCANSFCKSGITEITSKATLELKLISGLPCLAVLPLLVVMTTTPFDARIPYSAEAAWPFRMFTLSISLGSISTERFAKSVPVTELPVETSLAEDIGIPSTTYNGVLSPVNDREPRIVIFDDAPGIPEEGVISTPESLPCKAPERSEFDPCVNSSDLTSCTAYPRAFFSFVIPMAVTTTSLTEMFSDFSLTCLLYTSPSPRDG